MPKIQLVLVDQNLDYIEKFYRFIRETNYHESIQLKSFTNKETLLQFSNYDRSTDFYLMNEDYFPLELDTDKVIILTEHKVETGGSFPSIYKYQALNNIISQAVHLYENRKNLQLQTKQPTKTISIFSTTGHSGKTTFALNLAKELAQHYKVFYLDLQLLNSTSLFFPTEQAHELMRVLYYVKVNPEYLANNLNPFIKSDSATGIDYFGGMNLKLEDFEDLTVEELTLLLDILIKGGHYHFIILDLDSSFKPFVMDILSISDRIFWLVLHDEQYKFKTQSLLKHMETDFGEQLEAIMNRTSFILNKAIPSTNQQEFLTLPILGILPYIPKWKQFNSPLDLLNEEDYRKATKAIISSIL